MHFISDKYSEYTKLTSTAFYYTNRCTSYQTSTVSIPCQHLLLYTNRYTSYQTSTVSIPCQHLLLSTILTDALHIRQVQWVYHVNIYCYLLYSQTHFISDKYSEYTMSTSTAIYYTNRRTSYQTSTVSKPSQHLLLSTILTDALHIRQVQWVYHVNIYCYLLY